MTYVAKAGRVYVVEPGAKLRQVHTALTADGRDLERFEQARLAAVAQREQRKEKECRSM